MGLALAKTMPEQVLEQWVKSKKEPLFGYPCLRTVVGDERRIFCKHGQVWADGKIGAGAFIFCLKGSAVLKNVLQILNIKDPYVDKYQAGDEYVVRFEVSKLPQVLTALEMPTRHGYQKRFAKLHQELEYLGTGLIKPKLLLKYMSKRFISHLDQTSVLN